ncbi:histidine phosphatase family protein [Clostridium sp. BJN0001]|uniref:histidine phosphatase family protein n=1 Tax=Clostridium sp. BJN0001 TaxID=2930219 RepID=UPI001FD059F2|nr:histidine phosphatase family protein [Clostridium sp. BJN0001]
MKTTILLIRHGETLWNAAGKFQGCTDIALSERGIEQAKLLKKRLNGEFDAVYASPLKRAYKTAQILAEDTSKEVIIEPNIKEINFGNWEGLSIKEIENEYNEDFNIWRKDKEEARFGSGEISIKNASLRASACVRKIAEDNKGKTVVIVAHGGVIKAALINLFEWNMNMYHRIGLGNTCVTKIYFDDNFDAHLVYLNDTNHLKEEATIV